jgi:hypothetical protein
MFTKFLNDKYSEKKLFEIKQKKNEIYPEMIPMITDRPTKRMFLRYKYNIYVVFWERAVRVCVFLYFK